MATRASRKSGAKPPPPPDTERESAEILRLRARLAEAEQRNRDLLEGSLQGVMVHRDNRLLFANQAFADIFGYASPKDVLEMGSWQRCQAPAEVERMERYRAARMRGESPPARYSFEGRRKDGSPVWVENVARLIMWEGEVAILSSLLDMTEQRRAETELRRSETRFRIAFENAPMGIGLGFPETGYVQVNEEYCKFLGLTREELLNHPNPMEVVKQATHPDDFEKDFTQFKRLLAGEIDSYQMEKRFIRK
ncbi:MAG TPA: PAS domain S-box protein, partial [bacterium]